MKRILFILLSIFIIGSNIGAMTADEAKVTVKKADALVTAGKFGEAVQLYLNKDLIVALFPDGNMSKSYLLKWFSAFASDDYNLWSSGSIEIGLTVLLRLQMVKSTKDDLNKVRTWFKKRFNYDIKNNKISSPADTNLYESIFASAIKASDGSWKTVYPAVVDALFLNAGKNGLIAANNFADVLGKVLSFFEPAHYEEFNDVMLSWALNKNTESLFFFSTLVNYATTPETKAKIKTWYES